MHILVTVHVCTVERRRPLFLHPDSFRFLTESMPTTCIEMKAPLAQSLVVILANIIHYIEHLTRYGRPLLPLNRMQREIYNLGKQIPSFHIDSLRKYLQISSMLIPDEEELIQPVVRHPDLRPSNIFVSDDYEITSLIDWQNAVILPLFLQIGIPDLDNLIDSASNCLKTPQLPDDPSVLDRDSRLGQLELFCKRQLHPYMTETSKNNPIHYEALTLPFSTGRRRVYNLSCAPWQGDNIPLRSSLVSIKQQWPRLSARSDMPCPITFTEEEE